MVALGGRKTGEDMSDRSGRLAVVTGAANGIGAACAARLAADGASVVLLDRDADAVRNLADRIGWEGGTVASFAVDCTDQTAIESVFAEIAAMVGPVDILVNNVGQSARERMSDFAEADMAVLNFILDVNLKSAVICARQVVPTMKQRGWGRIISLTSESAVNGSLKTWDYSAAKAGVIGFTRSVARELAPFGVTVNAVGPGATATGAMEKIPADLLDRIRAGIPAGRLGRPEEIAHVVAFLADDLSGYVTGQTLLVNGGNWMI